MLRFILDHNCFIFKDKHYLQVHGAATGSKVAPSDANLAMGKIEETILQGTDLKLTRWGRFIDDILFICPHGIKELLKFHHYCNSIHPTIKFTMAYGTTNIPFLDTNMTILNNTIKKPLYSKPTDKHTYL